MSVVILKTGLFALLHNIYRLLPMTNHDTNESSAASWFASDVSLDVYVFFLIRIVRGGVQMGPLGTSATEWPIVPAPGNYDDGEFGGMKIGRGNRSTRRKPAPAPLCPPQILLDQTDVYIRFSWIWCRSENCRFQTFFFISQGKIDLLVQSCPCVCSPTTFKSFDVRETCYEYFAIRS
jgi:hypothetical protein